jgi:superfamily II DNA/RNA helicase
MLINEHTFIREVNQKAMIRYNVNQLLGWNMKGRMKGIISEIVASCKDNEKVLVFCRSRQECNQWAEIFKCTVYCSNSLNKRETLEQWMSGVLFATGVLCAGVDVDRIKAVLNIEKEYRTINFDQEVGRRGRAGEVVTAVVIIQDKDYVELLAQEPTALPVDEAIMREFIITESY